LAKVVAMDLERLEGSRFKQAVVEPEAALGGEI
jgi:hypothetical protein